MSTTTAPLYPPLIGPDPGSPEWFDARYDHIGSSEFARAIGQSPEGQPLDTYLEKRRLVPPFEGNEYTRRGLRFEPFIGLEYTAQTGVEIETGLPMLFSGEHKFLCATPDGRWKSDHGHLTEFKACNWRRAAQLGEEDTDEVFDDWLIQTQGQMYVAGAHTVDLFAMVDLHTYRRFVIRRNDRLIAGMVPLLCELWDRIQRQDPPPPDFGHPGALDLVRNLYGTKAAGEVELSADHALAYAALEDTKARIKALEAQRDELAAGLLHAMGTAAVGRLPGVDRELTRSEFRPLIWEPRDIEIAQERQGLEKRKGFVKLGSRKSKGKK